VAHIVLTTFGSLGDLHPFLAVGRELAARGHRPVVATHGGYGERVRAAGLEFHAVRPDLTDIGEPSEVLRLAMDARDGSDYVVRRMVLPFTRLSYRDLLAACSGADALVSHALTFAAPLVEEKLGLPRIHSVLQPCAFFSAHDPPTFPGTMATRWSRALGPHVWRLLWRLGGAASRPWFREVAALRAEVGLPPGRRHPLLGGHSSLLNLALFSPLLGAPQPDWPPHTVTTGFAVYDRDGSGQGMPHPLRSFLDGGPPPIVFTLGSSGVWDAGGFFHEAAHAAARLGRRAVLLTGGLPGNAPIAPVAGVMAVDYAPHSELFPRAAAVVHQGGIGTTGQALRAGRPMLIVPFSHDQPDNAARCVRLGVAQTLHRRDARAGRLEARLKALLADQQVAARAQAIGERMRREDGAASAVDALEATLDARAA
jgi:UDP:flavonoid glycosyltransferase YjiC (YdhE family)